MITEPYKLYTNSYRNPTSDIDGFVTIVGSATNLETFSKQMLGITIKSKTNDIYIELSNDGSNFDNKILMEAGEYFGDIIAVSYECSAVRFTNSDTSGSNDGKYQIIGWCDE